MNKRFHYPYKIRDDFLKDVVRPMVKQRVALELTQDDINYTLNVADRLVSKWECGERTPTSFNLYCWADALDGQLVFVPNSECQMFDDQTTRDCRNPSNNNRRNRPKPT